MVACSTMGENRTVLTGLGECNKDDYKTNQDKWPVVFLAPPLYLSLSYLGFECFYTSFQPF